MTTATLTPTKDPTKTADDVAERIFNSLLGAFEIQAIYLGHKLGWYEALATAEELTSAELAARTGSAERYAREWLEQQTATGYVTCADPAAPVSERKFAIDAATAEALTDAESLAFVAPFARFSVGLGKGIDDLAEAYRNGGGVSWEGLGEDPREAQAAANRPLFLKLLGQEFLPAVPDIHEVLTAGGRVADVGCGFGWSSVGIAEAYENATVHGYDIDLPSIESARQIAEERGLSNRVEFLAGDAAETDAAGTYDLVVAFECIHDLPDPVSVLDSMRRLARPGGSVIVMDEKVGEAFSGPADEVEQMYYGFSLMCCLADGMAHEHSVGTGTVMRPNTFEGYALDAGFSAVDVLPIEHDFFRFYRLSL